MNLYKAMSDKRDPRTIPTDELNEMMRVIREAKCWTGNYFTLDREQQRRATQAWVHEDVFGEAQ